MIRPAKAYLRLALAFALTTVSLLAAAGPAQALTDGYIYSHQFGSAGSGNGQINIFLGGGLAIDQSNGDVYLADMENHRVEKFDAAGNFLQAWGYGVSDGLNQSEVCSAPSPCQEGLSGTGPGQFREPSGIAVDSSGGPNDGDVYVSDGGTSGGNSSDGKISKFTSSGTFVGLIDGAESDTGKFENLPWQNPVAVDENGFVWVASGPVMKFSNGADNEFVPGSEWECGCFGGVRSVTPNRTGTRLLIGAYSNGIDSPYITSAGGTIIVDHLPCGGYFNGDTAFDPGTEDFFVANGGNVCVFTQKGEMLGTFGGGTLGGAQGIAVNATTGAVYVEDGNRIAVFVPRVVPDVTTGPATEVGHTDATLTGQVAPDPEGGGDVSSCHFDIGTDASYGTEVPCEQTTPYSAATPVTADVSGLSMETTYHYRLVAANSVDANAGQDMTFTPRAVLGLSTDDASEITSVSATLNGKFDPNNEETHYYFEWGPDTSYGNSTPLTLGWSTGDPPGPTSAPAQIEGLSSFTKYHYRIVAENGVGTSYGQDHTLTTAPPALPEITESAASDVDNDSATISAALNPGYGTTYYSFEYGIDTFYGTEVPGTEALGPDDAEDHPIATVLTGLQPGTTYHFRVVATNFGGTAHGPDVSFTTLDAPTIGIEGSQGVTQTSATLTADINPARSATSFHFEYGPTTEYGSSTRESPTIGSDGISHSVVVQLSGLQPGTTYHFRAVAKNAIGTRAGDDHVLTTAPAATSEVPAPPKKCKAGYVRRHGHCVKRHRKRRHHRAHGGKR